MNSEEKRIVREIVRAIERDDLASLDGWLRVGYARQGADAVHRVPEGVDESRAHFAGWRHPETDETIFDLLLKHGQSEFRQSLLHEACRKPGLEEQLVLPFFSGFKLGWLRFKLWVARLFGYTEQYHLHRSQDAFKLADRVKQILTGEDTEYQAAELSGAQQRLMPADEPVADPQTGDDQPLLQRQEPADREPPSLVAFLADVQSHVAGLAERYGRTQLLPYVLVEEAGLHRSFDLQANEGIIDEHPYLEALLTQERRILPDTLAVEAHAAGDEEERVVVLENWGIVTEHTGEDEHRAPSSATLSPQVVLDVMSPGSRLPVVEDEDLEPQDAAKAAPSLSELINLAKAKGLINTAQGLVIQGLAAIGSAGIRSRVEQEAESQDLTLPQFLGQAAAWVEERGFSAEQVAATRARLAILMGEQEESTGQQALAAAKQTSEAWVAASEFESALADRVIQSGGQLTEKEIDALIRRFMPRGSSPEDENIQAWRASLIGDFGPVDFDAVYTTKVRDAAVTDPVEEEDTDSTTRKIRPWSPAELAEKHFGLPRPEMSVSQSLLAAGSSAAGRAADAGLELEHVVDLQQVQQTQLATALQAEVDTAGELQTSSENLLVDESACHDFASAQRAMVDSIIAGSDLGCHISTHMELGNRDGQFARYQPGAKTPNGVTIVENPWLEALLDEMEQATYKNGSKVYRDIHVSANILETPVPDIEAVRANVANYKARGIKLATCLPEGVSSQRNINKHQRVEIEYQLRGWGSHGDRSKFPSPWARSRPVLLHKETATNRWLRQLGEEAREMFGEEVSLQVSENALTVLVNANHQVDGRRAGVLSRLPLGFFMVSDPDQPQVRILKFSERYRQHQRSGEGAGGVSAAGLLDDPFALMPEQAKTLGEIQAQADRIVQNSLYYNKGMTPEMLEIQPEVHAEEDRGRLPWEAESAFTPQLEHAGVVLPAVTLQQLREIKAFFDDGKKRRGSSSMRGRPDISSMYHCFGVLSKILDLEVEGLETPEAKSGKLREVTDLFYQLYRADDPDFIDNQQIHPDLREKYRGEARHTRLSGFFESMRDRLKAGDFLVPGFLDHARRIHTLSRLEFKFFCRTLRQAGKPQDSSAGRSSNWFARKGIVVPMSAPEVMQRFFFFIDFIRSHGISFDQFEGLNAQYFDGSDGLDVLFPLIDAALCAEDLTQLEHLSAMPKNFARCKQLLRGHYRFVHQDMCLGGFSLGYRPPAVCQEELAVAGALEEQGFSLEGLVGQDLPEFTAMTRLPYANRYAAFRALYLRHMAVNTRVSLTDALTQWNRLVSEPGSAGSGSISKQQWDAVGFYVGRVTVSRLTEVAQKQAEVGDVIGAEMLQSDELKAKRYTGEDIDALVAKLDLDEAMSARLRDELLEVDAHAPRYANMSGEALEAEAVAIRRAALLGSKGTSGGAAGGSKDQDRKPAAPRSTAECLAFLREVYSRLYGGKWLRLEQAAAVLLAYENNALLQQDTGEGKTLTSYLSALLHVLAGRKVDVLTHNAALAREGAEGLVKLAAVIGAKVAHRDDGVPGQDIDVFFSDVAVAVIDKLLREREGDTGARQADVGQFDEADNVLVDMASQTTMRVASSQGMRGSEENFYAFLCQMNALVEERGAGLSIDELRARFSDDAYCGEAQLSDERLQRFYTSALKIRAYQRDVQYIVADEQDDDGREVRRVRIMHKDTTGRVDRKSQWSDGAHQLVAARERWKEEQKAPEEEQEEGAIQVTTGSVETAPIEIPPMSEVVLEGDIPSFARTYDHRVGLSGTTGDETCREQISDLLGTDVTAILPRAKRELSEGKVAELPQDEIMREMAVKVAEDAAIKKAREARLAAAQGTMTAEQLADDMLEEEMGMESEDVMATEGPDSEVAVSLLKRGVGWKHRLTVSGQEAVQAYDEEANRAREEMRPQAPTEKQTMKQVMVEYSRRYDFAPTVHEEREVYFRAILDAVRGAQEKQFASLLFLTSVKECNQFYAWLVENGVSPSDIQIYDDTSDDSGLRPPEQMLVQQAGRPRKITLATAAGGRGTDFREVDVAILAKPGLQRVKEQMAGRVGRNGQLAITHEIYWAGDFGGQVEELEEGQNQGLQDVRSMPDQLMAWQAEREAQTLSRLQGRQRIHAVRSRLQAAYLSTRATLGGREQTEFDGNWTRYMADVEFIPCSTKEDLAAYEERATALLAQHFSSGEDGHDKQDRWWEGGGFPPNAAPVC